MLSSVDDHAGASNYPSEFPLPDTCSMCNFSLVAYKKAYGSVPRLTLVLDSKVIL